MNASYPVVTIKRKSSEDSWITDKIRKKIRKRKAIFRRQGRSPAWKKVNKLTDRMIKFKRKQYMENHKILITLPDSSQHFFRNVRTYNSAEKPKIWNIKSMAPEKSDLQLTIELAGYFNRISNEFDPLMDSEIPKTFDRELPNLKRYQVAMRLKKIKKPRSKIRGDIFPSLITEFCDIIAEPLTEIYNKISESLQWPDVWKVELVTVIPKCPDPKSFENLRNISCTLLVLSLIHI